MPTHSTPRLALPLALALACTFAAPPARAADTVEYDFEIANIGGQLEDRLRAVSQLLEKKDDPPSTMQGLRRRAQNDQDTFGRVLRSRGFYDGSVQWQIDESADPVKVVFHIERGPRYRLTRFDIVGLPENASDLASDKGLETLGVVLGSPALADVVLEAERRLLLEVTRRSYPFVEVADRRIAVDHATRTMEVNMRLDVGPVARFGEVEVSGLEVVEADYVHRRLAFKKGDRFEPEPLEETRKLLLESGVFNSVAITWGRREDIAADGTVPVRIAVAEADVHSIGAGVKYSSSEGFGGRAFWEHRNIFGDAERLRFEVEASELLYEGALAFRKPDFLTRNQDLLLDLRLDSDDTPAFDRRALIVSGGLEHRFSKRTTLSGGLYFEQSLVSGADQDNDRFTLFGIPLGLRYDGSDNLLHPSKGHRTALSVTPYISVSGNSVEMLVARGTESFYVPLSADRRWIWATRFTLGTIVGADRSEIPDDKRFYSGGGDSVRGYDYQKVGPLLCEQQIPTPGVQCARRNRNHPLGGRSVLQAGTELRVQVTDDFGVVPFVEGAGVYEPSYPDFGESIQWGAGLGFRYFTVAGPIRLDVAFPINPRKVDDIFEIYISLGQAF
ncbi:MAG TPA: autotransporter assembly complex family protein [Candidatus Binatia bacterium]|nr:autotransporter assembly complex family protein [Candidatus Binatia bacterium]